MEGTIMRRLALPTLAFGAFWFPKTAFALTAGGQQVAAQLTEGTSILAGLAPAGLMIMGAVMFMFVFAGHESKAAQRVLIGTIAASLFGTGTMIYPMGEFWSAFVSGPDAGMAAFAAVLHPGAAFHGGDTGLLPAFVSGAGAWASAWKANLVTHLLAMTSPLLPALTLIWPDRANLAIGVQTAFTAVCATMM